ncbi:MAG: flotillin family protein, partial [Nostoc sp. C3-bin3]|nr:flotillin family protein [Nostoc sp. C3-bin3]
MLFWLTFIQSLPSATIAEAPQINLQPQQKQTTLISQTLPVRIQPTVAQINGGLVFPGVIAALVLLLLFSLFAYTRVYVVTPNNEAFVRTGG